MTWSRTHSLALLAALLCAAPPALAQDRSDPFEAIVSDPDGANATLNATALPLRNPTEDELRQYLEAFRVVNLTASITLEDEQQRNAQTRLPVGNVAIGPLTARNGTQVGIKAEFTKEATVLRRHDLRDGPSAQRRSVRRANAGDVFRVSNGRTASFLELTIDRRNGATAWGELRHLQLSEDAVLSALELRPTYDGRPERLEALGPLLAFDRMEMAPDGSLHMKLNGAAGSVVIEKMYRDSAGNLVIHTDGKGVAGLVASAGYSKIRIRPDGTVQRWGKGFLMINTDWAGAGWKALKVPDANNGNRMTPLKLESSLPITRWPPHASDVIDLLPREGQVGQQAPVDPRAQLGELRPVLEQIPISDMSLHFHAKADPTTIRLSGPDGQPGQGGHLNLTDHELSWDANGRFKGRTYHSNPDGENSIRATGEVSGEVVQGDTRATIERMRFELEGTHSGLIPFENPEDVEFATNLKLRTEAVLSDVKTTLPTGTYLLVPGEMRANFQGDVEIALRPLRTQATDRSELRIDPDTNLFSFSVDGPVTLGNVDQLDPTMPADLPDELTVVAGDDPETPDVDESRQPVLSGTGQIGTKMGFLFVKNELNIHGQTTNGGAVTVLESMNGQESRVETQLQPGAQVHVYTYTFAGIKQSALDQLMANAVGISQTPVDQIEMGAANVTADVRVRGEGRDTRITTRNEDAALEAGLAPQPEVTLVLPNAALDARFAARIRQGTREGNETKVRRAAASVEATLTEGQGEVEAGLPGGPTITGTLEPGTRVKVDTGTMLRANDGTDAIQTAGFADGELGGRLEAHVIVSAGSLAHEQLTAQFQGRAVLDLQAALGLRLDPTPLLEGQPNPDISDPVRMALALSLDIGAGARLDVAQGGVGSGAVVLEGPTRITVHSGMQVDASTGTPVLTGLQGVNVSITAGQTDIQSLVAPLGMPVSMATHGTSTVEIRDVDVAFQPDGSIRLTHGGMMIQVAPGSVTLGAPTSR